MRRAVTTALMLSLLTASAVAQVSAQTSSPIPIESQRQSQSGCSFTGVWSTTYGDVTLAQDGDSVSGTYRTDRRVEGDVQDGVLSGRWVAANGQTGDIEFALAGDCETFAGAYRRGSSGAWTAWDGTLVREVEVVQPTNAPASAVTPTPTTPPREGPLLVVENRAVAGGREANVPIGLEGASGVGSINFSLGYDPEVVRVDTVEEGDLVQNSLFRANTLEPGIIRFGVAVRPGEEISGDGPIAHVQFVAVGPEGATSNLTLEDSFTRNVGGAVVDLDLQDGLVAIEARRQGDYDGDGCVTPSDASAALSMSVRELAEDLVLDVDGDSRVTAEDARLILGDAVAASGSCPPGEGPIRGRDDEPLTQLSGDPDVDAASQIPDVTFEPRAEDYSDDHPELAGFPISFNTLVVLFKQDASVGEVNSVLRDIDAEIVGGLPGVSGEAQGILILRTPTEVHSEMIALIDALDADPAVEVAVQDALMEPQVLPKSNAPISPMVRLAPTFAGSSVGVQVGTPVQQWIWEREDQPQLAHAAANFNDANWGLELIRAPQMWNLNAAIEGAGGQRVLVDVDKTATTGVLDVGFATVHEDLIYVENQTAGTQKDHGTHVAGTIGATFDNGKGVDGVNPYANLVVRASTPITRALTIWDHHASWGAVVVNSLSDLTRSRNDMRVVNISLAFNWAASGIDQDANLAAQAIVRASGWIFRAVQRLESLLSRSNVHGLPMIIVAAGNDSNSPPNFAFGTQDAKWSSPFTYAGLELDLEHVIVVESIARAPAPGIDPIRSPFSNLNGHVSAPGSFITSTYWSGPPFHRFNLSPGACIGLNPKCYATISGTSMAAPHVAGLVGYLYTIDPSLTHFEVRNLLLTNSVAVLGGASDRIDAFASVMDIDQVRNNHDVRRMLLDIDDGTADGNKRTGIHQSTDDADGSGGVGDDAIDMSDFRRWRDWLLITEKTNFDNLDGDPRHYKKDANGNGKTIADGDDENVFPRGDFNGDGKLDRNTRQPVPGKGGGGIWSDLEVLRSLFKDEYYEESELPALRDSWDLEVSASRCLTLDGVVGARSWVEVNASENASKQRTHAVGTNHIYTVASTNNLRAWLEGFDSDGEPVDLVHEDFTGKPGEDMLWEPACTEPPPEEEPSPAVEPPLDGEPSTAPVPQGGGWGILRTEWDYLRGGVCGNPAPSVSDLTRTHYDIYVVGPVGDLQGLADMNSEVTSAEYRARSLYLNGWTGPCEARTRYDTVANEMVAFDVTREEALDGFQKITETKEGSTSDPRYWTVLLDGHGQEQPFACEEVGSC